MGLGVDVGVDNALDVEDGRDAVVVDPYMTNEVRISSTLRRLTVAVCT